MLTIYRASAGAGKTHKLTGEYLMLLFSQPGAFRRILAVTFTNKATDEMKTRIVQELYHLAGGHKSDYLLQLSSFYSLTEKQVRELAKKILIAVLHDYSAFNISTIDHFFQQTMRAFTCEIGLQGGYGIEMDKNAVLSEAVDNMLANLGEKENKELLSWLLRFAEEKIEEGKNWNLRQDILDLGEELFKESYKAYSKELSEQIKDKSVLTTYKSKLYEVIKSTEATVKRLGENGLAIIKRNGLKPTDFKNTSRSPILLFEHLAQGVMKEPSASFVNLADNREDYVSKTATSEIRQSIYDAYEDGLNNCVKDVIALFNNLADYYTAKAIVRYYYTLGILTDISQYIALYREEKNVLLIADTTELLNKVIDGSDIPFIYEKTGTHVDHYMIDEFQDTSRMQWENFRPLLEESLAQGESNLVVGDVKQSIYRFRNSDWKLLDEQVRKDFAYESLREETLKENWRSCRHVVDFNNALFAIAPALLQDIYNNALDTSSLKEKERDALNTKIKAAYDKSYQHVPAPLQHKEGHVQVEFLSDEEDATWKDKALELLPITLERLQDKGYELKDIAILVRKNKEGAKIAEALLRYKEEHPSDRYSYDIISDEALFIRNSPAVRFLIMIMRYLKNPKDRTNRELVVYSYKVLIGEFGIYASEDEMIKKILSIPRQSLYELVEGLFRHFESCFHQTDQVFIQAFLDIVSEFAQRESPDLNHFLKWWDDNSGKHTISTPDGQNAIRIMTVHKSKGLGFKVVIIPFCDWSIDNSENPIIWCRPNKSPFNQVGLVPVLYAKELAKTNFAEDYFKERLYAFIDSLNTLYVAFTRAKEELIVFTAAQKEEKKDSKSKSKGQISNISALLWKTFGTDMGQTSGEKPLVSLSSYFNAEERRFEMGDQWVPERKKVGGPALGELPMNQLYSISPDNRLQLRLYGKNFFIDNKNRKRGTLMHDILSQITISADIDKVVEDYYLSGVINKEESKELSEHLEFLLQKEEVKEWYNGSFRILNEVDILFGKGFSKRPDRVMLNGEEVIVVDYKFGERQLKRYKDQVLTYIQLIKEMGYIQVKGYLWYVSLDKIEEVKK